MVGRGNASREKLIGLVEQTGVELGVEVDRTASVVAVRCRRKARKTERYRVPDHLGVWSGESGRKRTMDSASRSNAAVSIFAHLLMSNEPRTSFPRHWLLADLESAGGEPLGEWEDDAVESPQVRSARQPGWGTTG